MILAIWNALCQEYSSFCLRDLGFFLFYKARTIADTEDMKRITHPLSFLPLWMEAALAARYASVFYLVSRTICLLLVKIW